MSHPNPHQDIGNVYPSDHYKPHGKVLAKAGSKAEAHRAIVKAVGKHGSHYHNKSSCPVCSKHK